MKLDVVDMGRIRLSDDGTYHVYKGRPLYDKRFKNVMSFHQPGIAAIEDDEGAYHIDLQGNPIFRNRFDRAFGFYDGLAAVEDCSGWYHIDLHGGRVYMERYEWVGNFQEERCVVKDEEGNYFHIDRNGIRVYSDFYRYAGDFRYGIAVVYSNDGYAFHIDRSGKRINNRKFLELGVFHKGYAIARDENGYFHINKQGVPLYDHRFEWVEPFYNEQAFVRSEDSGLGIVDVSGRIIHHVSFVHEG